MKSYFTVCAFFFFFWENCQKISTLLGNDTFVNFVEFTLIFVKTSIPVAFCFASKVNLSCHLKHLVGALDNFEPLSLAFKLVFHHADLR